MEIVAYINSKLWIQVKIEGETGVWSHLTSSQNAFFPDITGPEIYDQVATNYIK